MSTNSNVNGYEIDELPVKNISESDFLKLQSTGWILVSVDNTLSDNLIYSFKKER